MGIKKSVVAAVAVSLTLAVVVACTCAGVTPAAASSGQVLYVDIANPLAGDSNPGTEGLPLESIQEAADRSTPGTTIYVKDGTYDEMVEVSRSGAPGAPVRYISVTQGGARVVATGPACFDLSSVQCIEIRGFDLSGAFPPEEGETTTGPAHGGALRCYPTTLPENNEDLWYQVGFWDYGCRFCIFADNIVHGSDAGIWLLLSDNNIVRDNVVYDCLEAPIRFKHSPENDAYNNLCYYNGGNERWGICFYGSPSTRIYHNTVFEKTGGAVYIYEGTSNLEGAQPGADDFCPPCSDSVVRDNIGVVLSDGAPLVIGSSTTTDRDPAIDQVYGQVDNQYHHNLWRQAADSGSIVSWGDLGESDHQLLSLAEFQAKHPGYGDEDMVADPLFVDVGARNFELQPASPAAGSASDGLDRGKNSGVDMDPIPHVGTAYPSSWAGDGTRAVIEGVGFGETRGDSTVLFDGAAATDYETWSDTLIVARAPEGLDGSVELEVETGGGTSPASPYWVGASMDWYLAEGSTGGDFETWVLVQNPGAVEANISLQYMTPAGAVTGPAATL
ncbi:MAG: right-handed parallel beta-helix repeat-containing protein, partial [Actinobacteria bacterium]|nr:right-handed parallel beta-helix repeat-containing protein [Actinomycetota bacterium]MBU1944050.1 right-handed parallel beta-helix repeat-containing protein [Actinomycetota bacterium]MBU2688186.1 right-handed parallel beta-helix repeat-containing protein [Actinomycetota bacterium]